MEYADGLKDVLIRKINKTEKNLHDLKLDYCRFVYGLSHRSKVIYDQVVYQVRFVDLDTMTRDQDGGWSRPEISGARFNPNEDALDAEMVHLGANWELYLG